jgi:HEAT repeat protein
MRLSFLFVLLASSVIVCAQLPESDRARTLLEDSLKDKNPDTRKQAVQALGLVGPREPYLSELRSMLDDKDIEVRLATITSLVDLKDKKTLPALQTALEDDVPEVSFAAARALWTLNDPKGHDALIDVLSGETKTSSGFLTKQKREALRMLHTPKPMFLFALKQGAAFAPVPGLGAGISSVQGILSDPSVSGRATTALLLATDKDPRVLQALRDALDDKEWSVRAAAVHAIALRNDITLEADLTPLFDDKNQAVRARAAAGYLRLEWIRSTARHPTPRARTQTPKA